MTVGRDGSEIRNHAASLRKRSQLLTRFLQLGEPAASSQGAILAGVFDILCCSDLFEFI